MPRLALGQPGYKQEHSSVLAGTRHSTNTDAEVTPHIVVVHLDSETWANHLEHVGIYDERELVELVGFLVFL